jgi:hypothetical protein
VKGCESCGDCGAFMRRLVRAYYPEAGRPPRRTHEEAAAERDRLARVRAARREFHARRRAEREARRAESTRRAA